MGQLWSVANPPEAPPKVVLVPPMFERDLKGRSRFTKSSYDYIAARKQLKWLFQDYLGTDITARFFVAPINTEPNFTVKAKVGTGKGSMCLRYEPFHDSNAFVDLKASPQAPGDAMLRMCALNLHTGLGWFANFPLAPSVSSKSPQAGVRYSSPHMSAGFIMSLMDTSVTTAWVAGRYQGLTIAAQVHPKLHVPTTIGSLRQQLAATTQQLVQLGAASSKASSTSTSSASQPPQPAQLTTAAGTGAVAAATAAAAAAAGTGEAAAAAGAAAAAAAGPAAADGAGTAEASEPTHAAGGESSSGSGSNGGAGDSSTRAAGAQATESAASSSGGWGGRVERCVGQLGEGLDGTGSFLLAYSPPPDPSGVPGSAKNFTASLEVSEGRLLYLSFYQHIALARKVMNPFEDENVVGITNYLDLGISLSTPLTHEKQPEAAGVQVGASWQVNKHWMVKGRVGPDATCALSLAFKSWLVPSLTFAASAVISAADPLAHPKLGVCVQLENFGNLRYEKNSAVTAGQALTQRHEATDADLSHLVDGRTLVLRTAAGKDYNIPEPASTKYL